MGSMSRIVKRYSNRKLYDTVESRYVTLDELARWVKTGDDVQILDNENGEDLTAVTFAQIILDGERRKNSLLPIRLLRELIQRSETALEDIASAVDRGVEAIRAVPERAGQRVQEMSQMADRLTELHQRIDDTLRRSVEAVTTHPAFREEIKRIERMIQMLETRVGRLRGTVAVADDTADDTADEAAAAPAGAKGANDDAASGG